MTITIENVTKARIVKYGPVRTFGDYDKRQRMNEAEMISVFDQAWNCWSSRGSRVAPIHARLTWHDPS